MTKVCKLLVGVFMLIGFLAPQAMAQDNTQGIAPRYLKYYAHAKEVLEQEDPAFLTAFQTLQEEISTIDSTDKQAQLDALMRFMPAIEEMTEITHYDSWYKDEGYRTLQLEVIFSFFSIHLPTADGSHTSVMKLYGDAFMPDTMESEASRLLTEEEIMEKYNLVHDDAHRVIKVWKALHRNWPW